MTTEHRRPSTKTSLLGKGAHRVKRLARRCLGYGVRLYRGVGRALGRLDQHVRRVVVFPFFTLWRLTGRKPRSIWKRIGGVAHEHYRLFAGVTAVVIVFAVCAPVLTIWLQSKQYEVSPKAHALAGEVNTNISKKLAFNAEKSRFEFNADAKGDAQNLLSEPLSEQIGGGGADSTQKYSVDIPTDLKQGITYHENELGISFTLTPKFKTMAGKLSGDRLVYPVAGSTVQVLYTTGAGGMKEDIILNEHPGTDQVIYSYELNLPKSLDAKLDANGSIGIYTADPLLYGDISYGTVEDQENIQKARETGDKTHLAMTIPAPYVVQLISGNPVRAPLSSKFLLSDDHTTLSVVTSGFDDFSEDNFPVSIDPSVTITSTNEFASGDGVGNASFTNDSLARQQLSGGDIGSISNLTYFNTNRQGPSTKLAVSNGCLFLNTGTTDERNSISSSIINADGTLQTWVEGISYIPDSGDYLRFHESFIYGGYYYVMGGYADGNENVVLTRTQFAPVNSDCSLGSWQDTTPLPGSGRAYFASAAYNGRVYIAGGWDGSTRHNGVYYANVNGDGSLGSWTATTSFSGVRNSHAMTQQGGYLYLTGGWQGSSAYTDIQIAKINADGTLGNWTAGPSLSSGRFEPTIAFSGGYIYVLGGSLPASSWAFEGNVSYAPVYADGTIGAWQTATTTLDTYVNQVGTSIAYNGVIYYLGENHNVVTQIRLKPAGTTGNYTATSSFTATRTGHSAIVANNYIYIIGGRQASNAGTRTVYYRLLNSDGTISSGTWATGTQLPATPGNRWGQGAFTYNNRLYVLGGMSSTSRYTQVHYAELDSGTGSVGSWTSTTALPSGRGNFGVAVYGNRVYVMGGQLTGTTATNAVISNTINVDGTLGGSWTTLNTLPNARYSAGVTIAAGRLYVLGGYDGSNTTNTSYLATIQPDGTVSSWNTTTALPANRYGAAAIAYNGYIYVTGGGTSSSTNSTTVYSAPIGTSDGGIVSWDTNTAFGTGRQGHAVAVNDDKLYITGGFNGNSTYYATVQFAQINNGGNGLPGTWVDTTNLPERRVAPSTVAYNGYVYVMGGTDEFNDFQSTVYFAALNSDGTVGSWNTTTSLASAAGYGQAVALNGYMYFLGGDTPAKTNAVRYAAIQSDGTLGGWSTTTSFTTARSSFGAVTWNGRIYIAGGDNGTATRLNDVQYAVPDNNGAISSWTTSGNTFDRRESFGMTAYNGYLYVSGGTSNWDSSSATLNSIQYAPINSDGSVGAWRDTTALPFAFRAHSMVMVNGYAYTGVDNGGNGAFVASINANGTINTTQENWHNDMINRQDFASYVTYNGYLYMVGGNGDGVSYAKLLTNTRAMAYEKTIALGAAGTAVGSIAYTGNLENGLGTISYQTAKADGEFGSAALANTVPTPDPSLCVGANAIWYVRLTLHTNGSQSATFPDSNSSRNRVEDITLMYGLERAPTEQRMRMGKWFSDNILQPYDICPVSYDGHTNQMATVSRSAFTVPLADMYVDRRRS